jgi:hypothetical protein
VLGSCAVVLGFAGFAGLGCRRYDAGLDRGYGDSAISESDAAPRGDASANQASDRFFNDGGPARPPLRRDPPPGASGLPVEVGCSDGSREGFANPAAWPSIAGCSGAWSLPGLLGPDTRVPQCARAAGDRGSNPAGSGCAVADLCALGWHVCEGPDDVIWSSPTDCEGAVPSGYAAFFVARVGASSYGLCLADGAFANDLHGCGTFGAPDHANCSPLDRRLAFADCRDSQGVWTCGGDGQHLEEASLVVKYASDLGGALCCRDR